MGLGFFSSLLLFGHIPAVRQVSVSSVDMIVLASLVSLPRSTPIYLDAHETR